MVEPDGFRDFVIARSAALVRSAMLLTGDEALAQDLVQAALAKTWSRWARVVRHDAPEAYVRRVMVSTFLTWTRRRWRREQPVAQVPEAQAAAVLGCSAGTVKSQTAKALLALRACPQLHGLFDDEVTHDAH